VVVAGAPIVASVTYAGDVAIVAVAHTRDAAALGIDAEPLDDHRRDRAGMAGVLGEGEATVRDWTRVEAVLKADGRGLRVDPAAVALAVGEDGWTATVPGGATYGGWDAAGPPGIELSVAILRTRRPGEPPSP
jgi:4'-phosphopantetheinyl transferase